MEAFTQQYTSKETMKIFQINDCDWWIGESLEACIADVVTNIDEDGVDKDARELTSSELDSLTFSDVNEAGHSTGFKRTFREQLAIEIAAGGEFPRIFASTEY